MRHLLTMLMPSLALIIGPHKICEGLSQEACTGLWSMDGVHTLELESIGLTLTAFPSAHSSEFSDLDFLREHPEDGEPDPFSIIFDFPGQSEGCQNSMLWANSTLNKDPYLNYTEVLSHDDQNWAFDYKAAPGGHEPAQQSAHYLLDILGLISAKRGMANLKDIIQPQSWSNHHHGGGPGEFFPDLHRAFPGLPLAGPKQNPPPTGLIPVTRPQFSFYHSMISGTPLR